uniref:Uncharacterized protein n=1 Tax=Chromera velia CCMP2878 TaxID=1169474 RepID=A0A0G4IAT8_9ALVE|eukprot:Cvel_12687.t1-p1 / transcript=Cvel_12687.t1 / gene=Cvel_12687 / organism=Chromera_velia_CCMP2878 / gene_product=hypothetical protein / transcript_product=hypothetical protein / location=Cvel_scaffold839:32648-34955(-) / protein_length=176 / sequence_SO=supercontig / SO=protein_coding / is_pseudo=false
MQALRLSGLLCLALVLLLVEVPLVSAQKYLAEVDGFYMDKNHPKGYRTAVIERVVDVPSGAKYLINPRILWRPVIYRNDDAGIEEGPTWKAVGSFQDVNRESFEIEDGPGFYEWIEAWRGMSMRFVEFDFGEKKSTSPFKLAARLELNGNLLFLDDENEWLFSPFKEDKENASFEA